MWNLLDTLKYALSANRQRVFVAEILREISLANRGNNRSLGITQGRLGVSVFHMSQSHLYRAEILILWCVQEVWRYSIVSRPTLSLNTNSSNYCSTRVEWFIQSNTLLRSKYDQRVTFLIKWKRQRGDQMKQCTQC